MSSLKAVNGHERHREPRPAARAIAYEHLVALWSRPEIDLREKLLWHMLYDTAARANEILALNVEDLDPGRKRADITGKGGHRQTVVWASGTARLLPRYLPAATVDSPCFREVHKCRWIVERLAVGPRRRGPLFIGHRQPNVIPAEHDRCPDTGHARLSYQRAWQLFHDNTADWTLHQLRHSALTHLGEAGVSTLLLQAKSRRQDPRTLARYAQPGIEAVARLTADHDPNRRHH